VTAQPRRRRSFIRWIGMNHHHSFVLEMVASIKTDSRQNIVTSARRHFSKHTLDDDRRRENMLKTRFERGSERKIQQPP